MRRDRAPISVAAIARRANVSRTFLYTNPDARNLLHLAASRADVPHAAGSETGGDDPREAPWRERALNAEEALKTAHAEIGTQRGHLGELMGQLRDLQAEWTQDSIQRVTTENTSLKQRLRQLTQDNRVLDERLAAARSTLRFQDRRLADLEAQLTHPAR
jgi:chromosome segregation ATPase